MFVGADGPVKLIGRLRACRDSSNLASHMTSRSASRSVAIVLGLAVLVGCSKRASTPEAGKADKAKAEPVAVAPAAPSVKEIPTLSALVDLSAQTKAAGQPHTLPDGTKVTRLGAGNFNVNFPVTALVMSPTDENTAVIADDAGHVTSWNIMTGEARLLFEYPGMGVRSLRFALNGDRLVGTFVDMETSEDVVVLDARSGQMLRSHSVADREYLSVDPSGKRALVRRTAAADGARYGNADETPAAWRDAYAIEDLDSAESWAVPMPASVIWEMQSPRQFVLAGKSGELGLWNVGKKVRRKKGVGIDATGAFSASIASRGVYVTRSSGAVSFYTDNSETGFPSQGQVIQYVTDSKDGSRVALVGADVIHVVDGNSKETLVHVHANPLTPATVALSASGRTLVWVSDLGRLETYAIGGEWKPAPPAGHLAGITGLAAAGGRLMSAGADGTVRVWDVASGSELDTLRVASEYVRSLVVSEDGNTIVAEVRTPDGLVTWDRKGDEYQARASNEGTGTSVRNLEDGKLLVGETDKSVRLWQGRSDAGAWDSPTEVPIGMARAITKVGGTLWVAHPEGVSSVNLDDRAVATKPFSTAPAAAAPTAEDDEVDKAALSMAWGPGAHWVLTGAASGLLSRYDVNDELKLSWAVPAHRDRAEVLAVSKNGKLIATTGSEGSLALWNDAGELIARHHLAGDADYPKAGVFLDNEGKRLAVGTLRGRILIFSMPARPVPQVATSSDGQGDGAADLRVPQLSMRGEFALPASAQGAWKKAFVIPDGDSVILGDEVTVSRLKLNARPETAELGQGRLLAVARNGQSSLIFVPGAEGTPEAVRVLSLAAKPSSKVISLPIASPNQAVLSGDGTRAVVVSGENWQWLDLQRQLVLSSDGHSERRALAMNPNGTQFAAATADKTGGIINLREDKLELGLPRSSATAEPVSPGVADFSPDGHTLTVGTTNGALIMYDALSAGWIGRTQISTHDIIAVSHSAKGDRVAAAADDGRVVVLDAVHLKPLAQFTWPEGEKILAIGFTKEKHRLVVVPNTGVARSFDVP